MTGQSSGEGSCRMVAVSSSTSMPCPAVAINEARTAAGSRVVAGAKGSGPLPTRHNTRHRRPAAPSRPAAWSRSPSPHRVPPRPDGRTCLLAGRPGTGGCRPARAMTSQDAGILRPRASITPVRAAGRGGGFDGPAGDEIVQRIDDTAPAGTRCLLQFLAASRVGFAEFFENALGQAAARRWQCLRPGRDPGQAGRQPVASASRRATGSLTPSSIPNLPRNLPHFLVSSGKFSKSREPRREQEPSDVPAAADDVPIGTSVNYPLSSVEVAE